MINKLDFINNNCINRVCIVYRRTNYEDGNIITFLYIEGQNNILALNVKIIKTILKEYIIRYIIIYNVE